MMVKHSHAVLSQFDYIINNQDSRTVMSHGVSFCVFTYL